ncbi:MAG: DUF177 domain-containing protein [Kiritimatiellia bacterium]|nr:DUF177 domain-containing protein [Kiritimatiellia bacterium]
MSLLIETGRLRQKLERICDKVPAASLEIDALALIKPEGPLSYDLTIQRVLDELIVRGTLKINMGCRCARCGDIFSKDVFIPDFCRNFILTSKNDLIDLTPEMREDILLALPMVAVCSDTCRGLCSGCGVNLNLENCRCERQDKPDVWRMLNGLHLSGKTRDRQ